MDSRSLILLLLTACSSLSGSPTTSGNANRARNAAKRADELGAEANRFSDMAFYYAVWAAVEENRRDVLSVARKAVERRGEPTKSTRRSELRTWWATVSLLSKSWDKAAQSAQEELDESPSNLVALLVLLLCKDPLRESHDMDAMHQFLLGFRPRMMGPMLPAHSPDEFWDVLAKWRWPKHGGGFLDSGQPLGANEDAGSLAWPATFR